MTSILAKFFGIYFFTIGLSFFINPRSFRKMCQAAKDESFIFIGAILALLIGAVVVALHNVWILDWPVIITVLGWWSIIKGFTFLTYPEGIKHFSFIQNKSDAVYRMISLGYLALGLFLLYKA